MSPAPVKTKNITEEMRAVDWSVIDKIRTGGGARQGVGMRQSMADLKEERLSPEDYESILNTINETLLHFEDIEDLASAVETARAQSRARDSHECAR